MSYQTMTIEKKLLTGIETMAYLNIGKSKFYELVENKILKNVSLDRNLRFDIKDIDALIETLKTTTIVELIEKSKNK